VQSTSGQDKNVLNSMVVWHLLPNTTPVVYATPPKCKSTKPPISTKDSTVSALTNHDAWVEGFIIFKRKK